MKNIPLEVSDFELPDDIFDIKVSERVIEKKIRIDITDFLDKMQSIIF